VWIFTLVPLFPTGQASSARFDLELRNKRGYETLAG
jgi:hypothetical protein